MGLAAISDELSRGVDIETAGDEAEVVREGTENVLLVVCSDEFVFEFDVKLAG